MVADEPEKRQALRAHMPEAATNWLNALSLGTMSVSAYIENLAKNSAHLINYQEISRSIKGSKAIQWWGLSKLGLVFNSYKL